jgi:hypothetical protein
MNFSLPGLLYSSIAAIRSSCAVLPSILQYSAKMVNGCEAVSDTIRTVATEQAVVLQNIKHAAHLRENENARALLVRILEQFVQYHHLPRILNKVLIRRVWRSRFL